MPRSAARGTASKETKAGATKTCRFRVELFGSLKRPDEPAERTVDLASGATVEDLLAHLEIATHHRRFVQTVVDDETLFPDDKLPRGKCIKLFVPVGGVDMRSRTGIEKGFTEMIQRHLTMLLVLVALVTVGTAEAGHYGKTNATLFLNGQVLVRFDELQVGTSSEGDGVEWLRYSVRALKGKAILLNVDYQDGALNSHETVRWTQSPTPMNRDFSNRYNYLDKDTRALIKERCSLDLKQCDLDSAKIRFHLLAAGRQFMVIWRPKSGEVYATW